MTEGQRDGDGDFSEILSRLIDPVQVQLHECEVLYERPRDAGKIEPKEPGHNENPYYQGIHNSRLASMALKIFRDLGTILG